MVDEVVLLSSWPSSYGLRVKIALEEKGITFEYREENLADKSLLLLQMNPVHRKIPVLIHKGKPICESLIILEYIDEVWRDKAPLLPSDPYQRAQARFWADYINQKIFPCARRLWMTKGEEQEDAKKEFIEGLKVLEGELGEKSYFGGEAMDLVDISLVPLYCWVYALETCACFNLEAECTKMVDWLKRCLTREIVSKSLPDPLKVYGHLQSRTYNDICRK